MQDSNAFESMAVGSTPLVRLKTLQDADGAEVWVKWEGANPTGSMKDRMALGMIEAAERAGDLKSGMRVVEATGGSTGAALAMNCAPRGYKAYFVTLDAIDEDKIRAMAALGAELEILESHGKGMTPELVRQGLDRVRELAAEPEASRALSGGETGAHRIEGVGLGFVLETLQVDLIDEIQVVSDEEAFGMARLLAQREGLFAGISSGANVAAALRVARRLGPGKRVVTVLCDSGLRYLGGDLFKR